MPMYDESLSLEQFALMDDRRVYIKSMMINNVVGMFWALRDMAIVLKRDDIIKKLDKISKRPYFNPENLSTAYYHITTGIEEVEFRNMNDSRTTETYPQGVIMSEVRRLIEELQGLMGLLLDTNHGDNIASRVVKQVEDREHDDMIPTSSDIGIEV
jgi:hypothetical protein